MLSAHASSSSLNFGSLGLAMDQLPAQRGDLVRGGEHAHHHRVLWRNLPQRRRQVSGDGKRGLLRAAHLTLTKSHERLHLTEARAEAAQNLAFFAPNHIGEALLERFGSAPNTA